MPQGVDYTKDRLAGRNGRIWKEYLAGRTQESIAEDYGVHHTTISNVLREIRDTMPEMAVAEERLRDLERLDAMHEAQFRLAASGDAEATRTALKILERRARMLGYDAPTKQEVSAGVRYEIHGLDE